MAVKVIWYALRSGALIFRVTAWLRWVAPAFGSEVHRCPRRKDLHLLRRLVEWRLFDPLLSASSRLALKLLLRRGAGLLRHLPAVEDVARE